MDTIEIIGFLAGTLSISAFLPQAIKTFNTKQTGDLSTIMLVLQSSCVALWIIYGVVKQSPSLVICNFITLLVVLSVLIMKIVFDRRRKRGSSTPLASYNPRFAKRSSTSP